MSFFGFGKKRKQREEAEAQEQQERKARTVNGTLSEEELGEAAQEELDAFHERERQAAGQAAGKAADSANTSADDAQDFDEEAYRKLVFDRSNGPWDVEDEDIPDESYIDLGCLKLPHFENTQIRFGVDQETNRVMNVTLTQSGSSLQLTVLAAPRYHGIWNEVRSGINQGEAPHEVDGTFGKEVLLTIPLPTGQEVPTRIVGVDGPRWMLRGIFTGQAAVAGTKDAEEFDKLFRSLVVDRGEEPVAPKDIIALTLPVVQPQAQDEDDEEEGIPDARPRGPLSKDEEATQGHNILQRRDMFSEVR